MVGEETDFRSRRFRQRTRFPGILKRGGVESPTSGFMPSFTVPQFGSYQPFPMYPGLQFAPIAYFNQFGGNPSFPNPGGPNGGLGGSAGGGSSLTIEDGNTPATIPGVTSLELVGAGVVVVDNGGGSVTATFAGSGSGSGILWGKVVSSTKNLTKALWVYTVQPYVGGAPSGGTISVASPIETENTNTVAYGFEVVGGAGGDQLVGTAYYMRPIPNGCWVPYVETDALTGSSIFAIVSMPNPINGACS